MTSKLVRNAVQFFKRPLIEGQYPVIPPPIVPSHINKPDYVNSPNPKFGEFDARPRPHTQEAIASIYRFI